MRRFAAWFLLLSAGACSEPLDPESFAGTAPRLDASVVPRRYVAYFFLEEYDRVVVDTEHSLAILDLCREHAMEPDDRVALEEFRPYILMMHARGLSYQAMNDGQAASALAHVNRGIMRVRACVQDQRGPDAAEQCEEIRILRTLGRELNSKVPQDSPLVTRKALRDAIAHERFEEAARLRDELKNQSGL